MHYPALDIADADTELALAIAQDFSPSAAQEHDGGLTIFFPAVHDRDRAREALGREMPGAHVRSRDVDDEDWARRSQENLQPVTIGRLTVAPLWRLAVDRNRVPAQPALPALPALPAVTIVIQPSMGFGTGHHPTTRLCLNALLQIDIDGRSVLDVGTGSGILAIAARRLGAAQALGIDNDPDAIRSAIENLRLNPAVTEVSFELADLDGSVLPKADIVTANLTGAQLTRAAAVLERGVRRGGILIAAGLLAEEATVVANAFMDMYVVDIAREDGWACVILRKPGSYSNTRSDV